MHVLGFFPLIVLVLALPVWAAPQWDEVFGEIFRRSKSPRAPSKAHAHAAGSYPEGFWGTRKNRAFQRGDAPYPYDPPAKRPPTHLRQSTEAANRCIDHWWRYWVSKGES